MQEGDVASEIADIIREALDQPSIRFSPEMALADIPGWDSIILSCTMIGIEQRFGFEFRGDEPDRLSDFNSLVAVTLQNMPAA
jgi:acyl carrier protein